MIFEPKTIVLHNGVQAVLRSPDAADAKAMKTYLKTSVAETEFLLRTPEECTETDEQEAAFLTNVAKSPYHIMIACFVDGEVAGNCSMQLNAMQKTRHRATVAIAQVQKYWGLGIGTAMFTELFALAKEKGVVQMELDYVKENQRARHLYEKMGFVPVGERPNSVRLKDGTLHSEIMMVKEL